MAQESLADAARRIKAEKQQKTQSGSVQPPQEQGKKPSDVTTTPQRTREQPPIMTSAVEGLEPREFKNAVEALLHEEKFDELDRIASKVRTGKSRFKGGSWKLNAFYTALCRDACEYATDSQFQANIDRLKRWIAANPESITARIGLAEVYYDWAWMARGEGSADVVEDDGWKFFGERLGLARQTLQQASLLKEKDPEWFLVMQRIGRSEGWDLSKITEVMNEGSQFEPLYYYLYREHANVLQPQWDGEPGDAERFAEDISNRIGGKEGAIIYYKMAATLHCGPCGDRTTFKLISWPRVQEGYKAIEEIYGISPLERNEIAHLAGQAEDGPWALQAFLDIGQKWDKGVWHTRDYYQYWRSKALRMPEDISKAWDESEQATQTPEGMKYDARLQDDFEKNYSTEVKKCSELTNGDVTYFVLGMKLDEHGEAKEIRAWPPTKLSECLIPKLSKQTTPPPTAPFWIFFSVNTKSLFGISNGAPLPEAGN